MDEVVHSGAAVGIPAVGKAQSGGQSGSADAADLSSKEKKVIPDKDVEDKQDFNKSKQELYDDYNRSRKMGESHKNACKKHRVDPKSDLGEALKRVYEKEIRHQN